MKKEFREGYQHHLSSKSKTHSTPFNIFQGIVSYPVRVVGYSHAVVRVLCSSPAEVGKQPSASTACPRSTCLLPTLPATPQTDSSVPLLSPL